MSELKVIEFPNTSLADIPAKLRDLADAIDDGQFGNSTACIVTISSDKMHVFGFGCEADGTVAHYLLACAQRKIEQPMLDRDN